MSKCLGGDEELIGDISDLVVVQFQVLKLDRPRVTLEKEGRFYMEVMPL